MQRSAILVVSLLLTSGVTYGQRGGGMHMSAGVRMAAPAVMSHASPAGGGMRMPVSGHLVARNGQIHVRPNGTLVRSTQPRTNRPRPLNPQDQFDTNINPVPGLGFDVPHFAATHPQGSFGFGSGFGTGFGNGFGRFGGRSRRFAAFFPFFDGGFMVAPQPIVEDDDGPYGDAQQADYPPPPDYPDPRQRARFREQPEVAPTVNNAEPQRESEQYVFVKRDGTIIFAVAYTWDQGNLRYVTTDGLRRSVSLDSLDLDATRQFNEQRGLSFRLPA